MIDCIIFSKDRACQLELLLRSMSTYLNPEGINIKVLYSASDSNFLQGYERLITAFDSFTWIKETQFLQNVVESIKDEYVMFLVDDICFLREFSINTPEFKMMINNENILTLSLRLSPNINFCFAANHRSPPPKLINNTWEWRRCGGDWGYAYSIDGNIFRKQDIIDGIKNANFKDPSKLETSLVTILRKVNRNLMLCFDYQRLVNFPLNVVDPTNTNRSLNISLSDLNQKFLAGQRISMQTLNGICNNMVHVPINNLIFESYT